MQVKPEYVIKIKQPKEAKRSTVRDTTPCSPLKAIRKFSVASISACHVLRSSFLLGLFFDPDE
jgi:hypothetical protein